MTPRGVGKGDVDGRAERGDETARAILRAARAGFARRGFAGASVREIARAARANPALVGYHFGSKEALYARVIDDAMTALRERIAAAIAAPGALADRIRRALAAYQDHLAADPEFPRLVLRGLLDRDPRIRRVGRAYLRPLVEAARPLLDALGAGPLGRAEDAAVSLFGAAVAPFVYAPLLADALGEDPLAPAAVARRRAHLDALAALVLEALTKQQEKRR